MKLAVALLALSVAVPLLSACGTPKDKSAREWERAECNRVIDPDARKKCLERLE
jgi:hypothetical protein